jgi:hypothetical protein
MTILFSIARKSVSPRKSAQVRASPQVLKIFPTFGLSDFRSSGLPDFLIKSIRLLIHPHIINIHTLR